MTSIARYRERDLPDASGSGSKTTVADFYWAGNLNSSSTSTSPTGSYNPGHEICQDRLTVAGPLKPNPLYLHKRSGRACSLNGQWQTAIPSYGTSYTYRYSNYYGSRLGSMWNTGIKTYPSPDFGYWLTEFLARVSPNQPIFNTPLFLWELQEFPELLRYTGNLLAGRSKGSAGDTWLAYSFGWKPLISDLLNLINFAEIAKNRFNQLVNARSQGRVYLLLTRQETREIVASSYNFETVSVEIFDDMEFKVWATGHWVMDDPYHVSEIQRLTDLEGGNLALIRKQLGLRYSHSTLWNMIPWSWLVDYLLNISSYLEACDNNVGVSLKDVSIMARRTAIESSRVISNPHGLKFRPHSFKREWKERQSYLDPSPVSSFAPALRPTQWANLAALVTAGRIRARF